MKKISYNKLLIFIAITAIIIKLITALTSSISDVDDIWQFYNSLQISRGKIIYKDFYSLTTPLFYFLSAIPLIFKKTFIAMKLMQVFYFLILEYSLYKIIKNLKIVNSIGCYLYIIISVSFAFFPIEYNGFITIILFTIISILLDIDDGGDTLKNVVLLGLLSAGIILTKQTTGSLISIATFLIYLIKYYRKNRLLKNLLAYLGSGMGVAFVFCIYLWITDSFKAFFDNCLFGAKSFYGIVDVIKLMLVKPEAQTIAIWFAMIIALVFVIVLAFKSKNSKIRIISILAIANSLVIYPIPNAEHIKMALFVALIPIFYLGCQYVDLTDKSFVRTINIILVVIYIGIIGFSAVQISVYNASPKINSKYLKCAVDPITYKNAKPILKYIKDNPDKKFYSIESMYSYVCFANDEIPAKGFDIFLEGNIGKNTPVQLLKTLENKNNIYIYIFRDSSNSFWQTPKSAREYIINNYQLVDKIDKYAIYKVK